MMHIDPADRSQALTVWINKYGRQYSLTENDIRAELYQFCSAEDSGRRPGGYGEGLYTVLKYKILLQEYNGRLLGHVSINGIADNKTVYKGILT